MCPCAILVRHRTVKWTSRTGRNCADSEGADCARTGSQPNTRTARRTHLNSQAHRSLPGLTEQGRGIFYYFDGFDACPEVSVFFFADFFFVDLYAFDSLIPCLKSCAY